MEKAFWDGIMESMKQDKPNYDQVIDLMKEVRDEICEMAPQTWREEIIDSIDLEILSQVLKSGNLDIDYLGRILEFGLSTLQKLSSPANDDEMKAANQNLLKELAEMSEAKEKLNHSPALAMIKGLRFVLEQIQDLKREISKARVMMMEPLLKGPAGLDYLRKAFANRYGSPDDAQSSLPMTIQWLSSVWSCKDQEWGEHQNSVNFDCPGYILICRQIFLSEQVVAPIDMETIISSCTEQLSELLDRIEDVGIEGIVETISGCLKRVADDEKDRTREVMMAWMLAKSFQAGDAVFEKLVGIALRQVGAGTGAALLSERVVKAAEVLVVAATVTVSVHGPWCTTLMGNM
ncbi:T-complex protein 11, putative isoform 2 [Hibiscus syriacus]|uniref:T-complex protein 11, putative isoform 2 n=1 Tax=Hibiscus syriacus TaxID=106335 RepID=A0A6A3BTX3_HIBSY|nr:T-complex protein 11, putative isoform 2 [Hibiscus syriacus]